jgi:hypothetical protein
MKMEKKKQNDRNEFLENLKSKNKRKFIKSLVSVFMIFATTMAISTYEDAIGLETSTGQNLGDKKTENVAVGEASIKLAEIWGKASGNLLAYRTNDSRYILLQSKKKERIINERLGEIATILVNIENNPPSKVVYLGIFGAFLLTTDLAHLDDQGSIIYDNNAAPILLYAVENGTTQSLSVANIKLAIEKAKIWAQAVIDNFAALVDTDTKSGFFGNQEDARMFIRILNYVLTDFENNEKKVDIAKILFSYPFIDNISLTDSLDTLKSSLPKMESEKNLSIDAYKKKIRSGLEWWLHSLHTEGQAAILSATGKIVMESPMLAASALNPCESCQKIKAVTGTPDSIPNFIWCLGDTSIVTDLKFCSKSVKDLLEKYLSKRYHKWSSTAKADIETEFFNFVYKKISEIL